MSSTKRIVSSGVPELNVAEVRSLLRLLRDKWRKTNEYNILCGSEMLGQNTVQDFCFKLVVSHMRKRRDAAKKRNILDHCTNKDG